MSGARQPSNDVDVEVECHCCLARSLIKHHPDNENIIIIIITRWRGYSVWRDIYR